MPATATSNSPAQVVLHVVGARPNFMKMAPLLAACSGDGLTHLLVHTGQHYDEHLNDSIFRDIGLRTPDIHLRVGSGSHAEQTARVMVAFESIVQSHAPALVVVAGDVNSTLACAIVAAKACVPVAHVEAGLRSFDRTMPEEVNRIVTDRLSSLFLTPSPDADENLVREGIDPKDIVRVGNLMVDSLARHVDLARQGGALERLHLARRKFALLTLHRPSNVDNIETLTNILAAMATVARDVPVVFPMHPRTRARLESGGPALLSASRAPGLQLIDPLGYVEFLQLQEAAMFVMTDSGGVQEETTALGVPCLTVRENTERPITVTEGTNTLVGTDPDRIVREVGLILDGKGKVGRIPELWDGHAGERAAQAIRNLVAQQE